MSRPRPPGPRQLHVDVDELDAGVGAQRERGFVRELLDLGIAHREAERRRPRGALARAAASTASPDTIASSYDRGGRGSDVGSIVGRARDRVDVARRVAHRTAHRARAPT